MKRSLSVLLVFSMLLYHLLPLNALKVSAVRLEPEFPPASSTEYSSGYSFVPTNNIVYGIDSDSIYYFDNGQSRDLYQMAIDDTKGFCTNGRYAYVAGTDGAIYRVDLKEKVSDRLFAPTDLAQIVGAGSNGLYLGLAVDVDDWGWYVSDLYSFDFSGTTKRLIANFVESGMKGGFLYYSDFHTDVSAVPLTIVNPSGTNVVDGQNAMTSSPTYINGGLYYLDASDSAASSQVSLVRVEANTTTTIARYSCQVSYGTPLGISFYDGVISHRNAAPDGSTIYYNMLTGERLAVPAEKNGYNYYPQIDEKTGKYYCSEHINLAGEKSFGIGPLGADGSFQPVLFHGQKETCYLIYDSYAYFQDSYGQISCQKIESFSDPISDPIPDNTPEAIQILVENRDVWMIYPEYPPMAGYRYGLLDFEGDGIPELYSNSCDGSMQLSSNRYYKVDLSRRTISEIPPASQDEQAMFESYELSSDLAAYRDAAGMIYYLCRNYTRVSSGEGGNTTGFLYLEDGMIKQKSLWSMYVSFDVYSYSFQGQDIADEASWKAKQEEFLSDYAALDITFTTASGKEAEESNDAELAELLTGLYNDFYANADFSQAPQQPEREEFSGTFAEYFLQLYPNNPGSMQKQESVAYALCRDNISAPDWSRLEPDFANDSLLSKETVSAHPELYYETLLLDAVSGAFSSGTRQAELSKLVEQTTASLASSMSSYSSSDPLQSSISSFTDDSEAFLAVQQFFANRCEPLTVHSTAKNLYDKIVENNGTTGDFYENLSLYSVLHQANMDVIRTLYAAKADIADGSEAAYIEAALDQLISVYESSLTNCLVLAAGGSYEDQVDTVMSELMCLLLEQHGISKVDFGRDAFVQTLFPVSKEETQYSKIYAAYALEAVLQKALQAAVDSYSQTPSAPQAALTVTLYDLLDQLRREEITIVKQQSKLLQEEQLLTPLKNIIYDGITWEYSHAEDCILAYEAYLDEVSREKALALNAYASASASEQPVRIVCLLNGKVYGFHEDTATTGSVYEFPRDELKLDKMHDMKAEISGIFTDESMTQAYDESQAVSGPLPLFCKVDLLAKDTKKPVVMDPGTGIYVPKDELPPDAVLDAEIITQGPAMDNAQEQFESKPLTLYHINMLSQGVVMEPDRSLTIHIPVNEAYSGATIYRVEEDGSFSKMDTDEADGFYRFKADKLGTFAVVYEEEDNGPDKTILAILLGISVVLLILLVCILVYIQKKR